LLEASSPTALLPAGRETQPRCGVAEASRALLAAWRLRAARPGRRHPGPEPDPGCGTPRGPRLRSEQTWRAPGHGQHDLPRPSSATRLRRFCNHHGATSRLFRQDLVLRKGVGDAHERKVLGSPPSDARSVVGAGHHDGDRGFRGG
jgi:hypothetical protein